MLNFVDNLNCCCDGSNDCEIITTIYVISIVKNK